MFVLIFFVCSFFLYLGENTSCFFFFFQAEDGIRHLTVTGVQTRALPISPGPKSTRYGVPLTTIAVAGPERSGSGRGVPVPSMTICVVGVGPPRLLVCFRLMRLSRAGCWRS